ncbi:hypothetical protein BGW38_009663 [Lunasporangiospora selenospora]|uniref:Uncharacterized protein n=1 Tax=Lunasporangiospora selenospora TaxID=979761 RepID=A0A9P6FWW4_9FUNG|nr:hypothetical protein BGW38_009663 [Lunasporangiospora selenospora]
MASIIPFPTVATHRKLPHLQNTPKPTTLPSQQLLQQQQQEHASLQTPQSRPSDDKDSLLQLPGPAVPLSSRLLEDRYHDKGASNLATHSLLDNSDIKQSFSTETHHATLRVHDRDQILAQVRPAIPLGASLSPSSGLTPALSSHDSKMMKSALYDAFGCLHHPSAHTKHSVSPNAIALRSGDVTPLMSLSPKASPLLRPNLGPSAPITPLELSDEATANGYFGIQSPATLSPVGSSIGSSTTGAGTGSTTSRSYHHHPHHHQRYQHTSSHLNETFTSDDFTHRSLSPHGNMTPKSLSRRSSMDLGLNPTEHPVLSSLQSLTITSSHQLYHPHLGHDLGRDVVPLNDPVSSSVTVSVVTKTETVNTVSQAPTSAPTTQSNDASQSSQTGSTKLQNDSASLPSPFPMDHGGEGSIGSFGHQGLV